jgi:hypothetical protein
MGTEVYKQENFSRNRKRLQRADKRKIKRRLTNQKVKFRKYKAEKRDGLRGRRRFGLLLDFVEDSFALGDRPSADRDCFVSGGADECILYKLIDDVELLTNLGDCVGGARFAVSLG